MPTPPTGSTFEEAVVWFRARVPITDAEYQTLSDRAKRRAFTVAGVAQLDVIQDVHTALEKALIEGTTLEQFKKDLGTKLRNAWAGSVNKPGHRLETIFRTNVQSAYAAGRWKQLTDPDVLAVYPWWVYDSVLDSRTSSICSERNGVTLHSSDPWWNQNYPPSHHRCFPSGTMITTRLGKKPIEQIQIGDLVLTHKNRYRPVTDTQISLSPKREPDVRPTLRESRRQ